MISRILFLVLLALFSHTENVAEDILVLDLFNKSLTTSVCSNLVILTGEQIVLTASLNASQTNLTEWPFDIFLQEGASYKNICKMSVELDSCPGYTSDCGYCHYKEDEMYYLVFNITAKLKDLSSAVYKCLLVGAKLERKYTKSVQVFYASYPYATTIYTTSTNYSVKNISSDTFIPIGNYQSIQIELGFKLGISSAWRYSTESKYILSNDVINFNNLTSWDANVDNTINIQIKNYCGIVWTITVPVTDRPEQNCDLPTLSRSYSSGTIIFIKCRMPTPYILLQSVTCLTHISPPDWLIPGTVVIDEDLVTCVVDVSNSIFGSLISAEFKTYWSFLLDTQFTDGTKQLPRIVRFNINGTKSVTVEPGTDISFECKVYGNPSAISVLVGTGIGRIQENLSSTDLLRYTLTGVQCQDTGRYWCKGVSEFGTTPFENQAYVDVNVRCPLAVRSHSPSNQDRKFSFVNDVLITLEIYGYPAPTEFGLQEQQGSSFVNVSKDKYTTKYVPLNPSIGLVSLLMPGNKSEESHVYILTAYNNVNKSVDFQFEVVQVSTAESQSSDSQSSWLPAFISVMCILGVAIIIIIIFVVKLVHKKDGSKSFTDLRSGTPQSQGEGGGNTPRTQATVKANIPKQEPTRQESRYSNPTPDSNYKHSYLDPTDPGELYETADIDDTYENVST